MQQSHDMAHILVFVTSNCHSKYIPKFKILYIDRVICDSIYFVQIIA